MAQQDNFGISRADFLKGMATTGLTVGLVGRSSAASAQDAPPVSPSGSAAKPATKATTEYNALYRNGLPFDDVEDFKDAHRGLLAALPDPAIINNAEGVPVWDLSTYSFLGTSDQDDAPDTVNPSLWRMAKLNMIHGLFEVVDGVYQARGYDLSVMSIIRTDTGYIVIDPLVSSETASAVWKQLVIPKLGDKPIVAVIYTHSHVDHYGGVRGLVNQADIDAGKVKILAPEDFTEAAVGENIIAGNAMSRRASYMYGNLLPRGATGQVDGGLGKSTSSGEIGLALPTDWATETGQKINIDGVELQVLMAPNSEAPSEFMFYIPRYKAFCAAEDACHTLHNLYTLRGAKVRDGLLWSKYLQQALDMFGGETEVLFTSHHWPTWGNDKVVAHIEKQRDLFRFIHDQVMRMANSGMTPKEIGEVIRLPQELATTWACRSYYGTVYHDAVAQYNLRLGFFDGVPATLHQLPPTDAGARYVNFMGGADNVLRQAKESFDQGDYRWVAEVVNHVVFADANNIAAKQLLADTYEQLGYQAESGPWRNFYLTGARELRQGVTELPTPNTASPDTIKAMPIEMFFDFLGVRLNGDRAAGKTININMELTDTNQKYAVGVANAAIHYSKDKTLSDADVSIVTTREALNDVMLGTSTMEKQVVEGKAKLTGDPKKLAEFVGLLDNFEFWFNIVTA
ncbi:MULTISPECIES: alkyl/aryl-sulfatase [unclassified Rhizobium]|uniref:alkyl/aryl-sulfatase n=1 Tax=unclassified Rhizobium TaxID=2613769 RepID=UPI002180A9ED|nr:MULTISPECIES: alkyl sulfatase dimerization domain-containing protein [unclassified Rhizobium]MBX5159057.1 MBL fold metallo-hydrolase [Rhizobium sp. NZLR8]MBX5165476.1 MBL fold metallo-hydrolase [Rhizobium sp. NZLR4b]MBX5190347.1 MBL fold metallo-hydrolase [Rhizobium sp. NZLR3b]MBX5212584.1 MBL fold metallo-hydrolase [Rhizobium sp. NZLR11]